MTILIIIIIIININCDFFFLHQLYLAFNLCFFCQQF